MKGDPAPAGSGLAAFYDKAVQSRLSVAAHVQDLGWMAPVAGGQTAGTEGRSLRVEAFRIRLTGELAEKYDVFHHMHGQNFGWLGWAKNGEDSGTGPAFHQGG